MIPHKRRFYSLASILLIWLALAGIPCHATSASDQGLKPVLSYISSGWDVLTRSMTRCDSLLDPKLSAPSVLYLPADSAVPALVQKLHKECKVRVEHLPVVIRAPGQIDVSKINPPGLLFLENSYVVPGGRFNEMYGWDSYFIIRGLLRDGRLDLARGIVENFFFEIEHYGAVLNANRTYFLTRSQPPFLTSMILGVYEAQKAAGKEDVAWLGRAYNFASKDHDMWVREPHLAGDTGLSRYFDFGEGPVPEGLQDESGYYRGVAAYYLKHPEATDHHMVEVKAQGNNPDAIGFTFPLQLCEISQGTTSNSKCDLLKTLSLSKDFYKGDRSMRESGFDISFRFGPFSADTHHYAPVCLNSLLYKTEKDLEHMSTLLGRKADAEKWRQAAEDRKQRMQKYLWDGQRGMFFDYNFETGTRSSYEYVTTFYPLWAGLATPQQARVLVANLPLFEQPGGIAMSRHETGVQWDYPYGWAPLQLLVVEGLRRYGFNSEADRISYKFLSTVAENFRRDGTIREKYNVVTRSSESHVTAGYQANVVGFGWTNGVFLELLHSLSRDWTERLAREQSPAGSAPPKQ